jgi:hypothetical protein
MENLELRESLQRYVRTDEPPFAFSAQSLVAEARRRQRRRIVFGLGGGGAFTALAVASTMVLVPGVGGGEDLFDSRGCRWVLPVAGEPRGTPQPSAGPPAPASDFPTPSSYPGSPTSYPGSPTSYPGSPTSYPGSPTAQPPTPYPTAGPPTPSASPDRLRDEVNRERQEAMSCLLKKQMLRMLPGMNHMAPSEPPMEVIHDLHLDVSYGWYVTYSARTMVIHDHQACLVSVWVARRGAESRPPHGDRTTTPRGHEAYVSRYAGPAGETLSIEVFTRHSRITITSEGSLLTLDQLFELADAGELDLYR